MFGLAGLTARAEPINRVIERAKCGTENLETLDRFAIPEDRREIRIVIDKVVVGLV